MTVPEVRAEVARLAEARALARDPHAYRFIDAFVHAICGVDADLSDWKISSARAKACEAYAAFKAGDDEREAQDKDFARLLSAGCT